MKILLLASLRGNIFLYYGEELGLTQVDIAFEELRDPEAIANWPLTLSRDGARTPMPWCGHCPQLGFGAAKPWLPVGVDHAALAVDLQDADPHSLLNFTRAAIALRNRSPALRWGHAAFLDTPAPLLAFERDETLCAFNFGDAPLDVPAEWRAGRQVSLASGTDGWTLDPWSGLIAEKMA
jgi:alpha-glucosidase